MIHTPEYHWWVEVFEIFFIGFLLGVVIVATIMVRLNIRRQQKVLQDLNTHLEENDERLMQVVKSLEQFIKNDDSL